MSEVTLNPPQYHPPNSEAAPPAPPATSLPPPTGPLRKGEVRQIKDSLGRMLSVRQVTALDKLRLFKALGPALSQNQMYLGMAVLAAHVVAIDGDPLTQPMTERLLEANVDRVGDEGTQAVAELLNPENTGGQSVPDAAKNS